MRYSGVSSLLTGFLLIAGGCSNPTGTSAANKDSAMKTMADPASKKPAFTVAMVDNKKDPSCGMPVTAGIGDTLHYAGKVIGFCSKECKDDFLKDPVAGLKKTEFKK